MLPPTPTHSHRFPSTLTHSQPLPSSPVYCHSLPPTPIHSHPLPSTPSYYHSLPPTPSHSLSFAAHPYLFTLFLAYSHSFSAHFYPLTLIFSQLQLNLNPLPAMYSPSYLFPVHIQTVLIFSSQLYFFFSELPGSSASGRRLEY